jgi:hypothetical protein
VTYHVTTTLPRSLILSLVGASLMGLGPGCNRSVKVKNVTLAAAICQAEGRSLGLPPMDIRDARPGDTAELVESLAVRSISATEDEEYPKVEEVQETRRTTLAVRERRPDGSAVVERTVSHAGCRYVQTVLLSPDREPQVLAPVASSPAPPRSRLPVPPSVGNRADVMVRQSSSSVEAAPETCVTAIMPGQKRNVGKYHTERAEEVIFCPDLPLGLPFARLVEVREQRLDRPELVTRRIYRLNTTGARTAATGRIAVDPKAELERWMSQLRAP